MSSMPRPAPAARSDLLGRSAHVDTFVRDRLPPPDAMPQRLFALPELQFPAQINCAAALLDQAVASGHGARLCLQGEDQGLWVRWTYAEVQDRVNRLARVLVHGMGLLPGQRVLLRGVNSPMLALCWLAVVKAGGIAVGSMPLLRARELATIIDKAQVSHALCEARLAPDLLQAAAGCPSLRHWRLYGVGADPAAAGAAGLAGAAAAAAAPATPRPALAATTPATTDAPVGESTSTAAGGGHPPSLEAAAAAQAPHFDAVDTAADDPCLIAFTSGTTGVPKGTVHFHRDVMAACACWPRHVLRPTADDVFIGSPPLAFTFGLGGLLLFPLSVGASTVLLDKASPDLLLPAIGRCGATVCFTAPTSYRAMAQQLAASDGPHDLRTLRHAVSAGEALPPATRLLWQQATGLTLIDGIGSTELLHIFISADARQARPGATGLPVPGYVAAVLDAQGRELPTGEVGRLAVQGPTGCKYLDDPRQAQYVQGGWNLTGDAYRIAEDGQFEYQARTDDMIISGGYNIAGPEVEAALLLHPAVAECGVVGQADEARGMVVAAHVVLRAGHEPGDALAQALQDFVKQTIAPYKYPRVLHFCSSLPRTETGKLQRFRLRSGGG